MMLKKPDFLNARLNLFMNNFYKHIFRSSRLQMFFKMAYQKSGTYDLGRGTHKGDQEPRTLHLGPGTQDLGSFTCDQGPETLNVVP